MIGIQIKNVNEVVKNLQAIRGPKLRTIAQRGMNSLVKTLEQSIKTNFSQTALMAKASRSKQFNPRINRAIAGRGKRFPSDPGKPPAIQTGQLRATIKSEVLMGKIAGSTKYLVVGVVGNMSSPVVGKDYGTFNELGTGQRGAADFITVDQNLYGITWFSEKFSTHKRGMQRRPFLQTAFEKHKRTINDFIKRIDQNFNTRI
jgi:hypothetical protein